jgi:hypothetical protein
MARKIFGQRIRFESPKRNLLKKIRLFRGSGTGDPSVFSSGDKNEDVEQPIGYNPHAYAVIDKRLHEIEAQKAMALARTQRLTF